MKTLALFLAICTSLSAHAEPQVFKLYSRPNPDVAPFCDRYTKLVLEFIGTRGYATLSDELDGVCEIYVPENKRTYPLALRDSNCGSQKYIQRASASGAIEVTDNRARTCDDVLLALIVVKEYDQKGNAKTMYSKDN